MLQALTGFVVVGAAILLGYVIGRTDLLGPHAKPVLARLTYFALSPVLLFVVLSQADVHSLFSALLPVSTIAALAMILGYAAIARFVWKRSVPDTLIGALSSGQVNANNIGIPLSVYLLGSAAYPAPVILMQLVLLTPISMAIFEATTGNRSSSVGRILLRTVTNPIVVGAALGASAAALELELPPIVMDPLELIAGACVPVLLISYGISLHGQRVLGTRGFRRDIVLASVLKLLVMPVVAWAAAVFLFHMPAQDVLVVVTLAAFPTAQNVFNYAQRFDVGEVIARDSVFLTTLGCVPVLFGITFLLG